MKEPFTITLFRMLAAVTCGMMFICAVLHVLLGQWGETGGDVALMLCYGVLYRVASSPLVRKYWEGDSLSRQ